MGIKKALPSRGAWVWLWCDNRSNHHCGAETSLHADFEAIATVAAIEAAARDAAEELLRRAKAKGWRVSEDGESALCPACCGGQGGG